MITSSNFSKNLKKCASCDGKKLQVLYDFGKVPLAGYFPPPGTVDSKFLLDMRLLKCEFCSLVQISPDVDGSLLFEDYRYASRYSMKNHFKDLSEHIEDKIKLNGSSKILEIGCNDGTLMSYLREKGYMVQGIDPSINVTKYALEQGLEVQVDFFSSEFCVKNNWENSFDMIISTNSFAHISNIKSITKGVSLALKNNGVFLLEVQSWPEMVKNGTFDFIYHEHKYYYDLTSLNNLLSKFNLFMEDVRNISIHGGSYRILFRKIEFENESTIDRSLQLALSEASPSDLQIKAAIITFFQNISYLRVKIDDYIRSGMRVIGFGASGRANMLVAYLNPKGLINLIYDESPERYGRQLGFSQIQIRDLAELKSSEYDVVVVFAWNFFIDIKNKWPHPDKKLIQPLPFYLTVSS